MKTNTVEFLWQESRANNGFHTGVSLHSHTMYSQEGLTFIPRYAARVPILAWEFERQHRRYQACHGKPFDFTAAYWTPPLPGREAYEIERSQIEKGLGLKAMVSLTDHDNIEAGTQLQVLEPEIPISVEWTIPFDDTYFHIGVHNLPRQRPRDLMAALASYTADPKPGLLAELLAGLHAEPGVLIVLNHPMWDQGCLGAAGHKAALLKLIANVGDRIHAVELNGLRPWAENRAVMELARNLDRILISGGDRHGREPNASINLTAAASFDEFADEVRSGQSHVLFMLQYREPLGLRILQTLCDVLRDSPELTGRQSWSDRVFYAPTDRNFVPLSSVWKQGGPAVVRWFVRGVELIGHVRMQRLLRVLVRRDNPGSELEFTGLPGTSPAP